MRKRIGIFLFLLFAFSLYAKEQKDILKDVQADNKNFKSGNYYFAFDMSDTCKIVAYIGDEETVIIPSEIEGLKVIRIQSWLSKTAHEITIPASVKVIEKYAFFDCNLYKINFEEDSFLEEVNTEAFAYNHLEEFVLPDREMRVWIDIYAFNPIKAVIIRPKWKFNSYYYIGEGWQCSNLTDVELVEFCSGTSEIYTHMFCECKKLKKVILPDTIKRIGSKAFYNCISLTEINIPENFCLDLVNNDKVFYKCPLDFNSMKKLREIGYNDSAF